jgi:hypothetical protein
MSGTPAHIRTFWLSFCDGDRPTGEQFLGACIVEVSEADAVAILPDVQARFPHAKPGAEWIAAASRHAHLHGCNPGGEMLAIMIPDEDLDKVRWYPRDTLMNRATVDQCDRAAEAEG